MTKLMKEMNPDQRPREKLINEGFESLSEKELLAIIISTGSKGKNALELAQEILDSFSYEELRDIEVRELSKIGGIKAAKASKIVASLQFGIRVNEKILARKIEAITSPRDAYEIMRDKLEFAKKEYFYVILLNSKNVIISKELISIGDLNTTIVNPREVFKPAIKKSANGVILIHNHPSGNPSASKEDYLVTQRLKEAGEILEIDVIDHIIIGHNDYYSFKREGKL